MQLVASKTIYLCSKKLNYFIKSHSPIFVGPSDMEEERSRIRRRMMVRGIFRLMIQREASIVQQVLQAYINNPTLHDLEMKVKFVVERGQDGGGLRRELVGCFWDEFSQKFIIGVGNGGATGAMAPPLFSWLHY